MPTITTPAKSTTAHPSRLTKWLTVITIILLGLPAIAWGLLALAELTPGPGPGGAGPGAVLLLLPLFPIFFAAPYMTVIGAATSLCLMFRTSSLHKLIWGILTISAVIGGYFLFVYWLPTQ